MQACVAPSSINAAIGAPPSKSMTQRAYAAALLHRGKTIISNYGSSADEYAALGIIQQLGAAVRLLADGRMEITSNGVRPMGNSINCHESGLAARLFTPIASLSDKRVKIDGSGSLLKRPMYPVDTVLRALGVKMLDYDGHLPFTIEGPLVPADITMDGSHGSQLLSGLLMAIGFTTSKPVTIRAIQLQSVPYVNMTLEVLAKYGIFIQQENNDIYIIPPFEKMNNDVHLQMEGDWSSAAPWLVAGAIAGTATVGGLNLNSRQADKEILTVLRAAGAGLITGEHSVQVEQIQLKAFAFDARHCPDLFPILSVLAACCQGGSSISGVERLTHKESNRATSITSMLNVLGVPHTIADDTLHITGVNNFSGGTVSGYNDHRIVMAATIAALRADGPICVTNAEAVNKSYPGFFSDAANAGISLQLNQEL